MFRALLVSALLACAGASRIQTVDESESQTKTRFGASCDHLQTIFRNRLEAFQGYLDTTQDSDAASRATQVRIMMRTYGIIRTLRRARTCSWVIENDSDEIEQARAIVQSLLAGNPCAEVARSELERGVSAENGELELESVRRAMSVLSSDSCEPSTPEESADQNDELGADAQLIQSEDLLQDGIDDMQDDMQEGESSFVEAGESHKRIFRRFMRAVGIAFLMIFLLLACAGTVALIGLVLGIIISDLLAVSMSSVAPFVFGGLLVGGSVGIAGCSYRLYTQLLPRLTQ